jgi:2-polyprenyl-6-methoxyphenol hydroxylase-like FAD-dependent oxidoreductase
MGVTKAAQDAVALEDAIAQHGATPQALQAYEERRVPECEAAADATAPGTTWPEPQPLIPAA